MTTTARSIIERAHIQLQDADGTRWPAYELVLWLNDAQREVLRYRPDQKCTTASVSLATGFRQSLPAAAVDLIDIPNNAVGNKRRINKIDMQTLDAVMPAWRNATPAVEVKHFMYDMREPNVFHVYPPAAAGAAVDMTYSLAPTDVAVPTEAAASSVVGNVDLSDTWADALLNFVLFKAYSKDAEFGGNSQLASGYLALFNAAIGSQLQSTATVAPKT